MTLQAVSKHLKVLEDAGLVSRSRDAQRRPVHLEATVFDLMTGWIERYRRQAEERYRRLDDLLQRCSKKPESSKPAKEYGRDRNQHARDRDHCRPDVPLVRIVREFDASREQVFRAHVEPELVVQWLGPRRHEMQIDHYDCRTGGSYRYVHVSDGNEYGFHGCFHEVRPSELIVQTFTYEGQPDEVALERLVLEDLGDGRTRLTATSLVDSFVARDAFVASGMEDGVREGYERLDELFNKR